MPLFSISSLQATLVAFRPQLVQTTVGATPASIDPRITLVPFCSANKRLSEHTSHVLSDICHSLSEIAQSATTSDGQEYLKKWITEPNAVEDIIGFWEQEYIVE